MNRDLPPGRPVSDGGNHGPAPVISLLRRATLRLEHERHPTGASGVALASLDCPDFNDQPKMASFRKNPRHGTTAGLIVFAHGSRIEAANEGVRAVARELTRLGPFHEVEAAFLELADPDLPGAAARLTSRGIGRIVVLPYFLTPGLHLERDLPELMTRARSAHPEVEIRSAQPLDGHPLLLEVLLDRAAEALSP